MSQSSSLVTSPRKSQPTPSPASSSSATTCTTTSPAQRRTCTRACDCGRLSSSSAFTSRRPAGAILRNAVHLLSRMSSSWVTELTDFSYAQAAQPRQAREARRSGAPEDGQVRFSLDCDVVDPKTACDVVDVVDSREQRADSASSLPFCSSSPAAVGALSGRDAVARRIRSGGRMVVAARAGGGEGEVRRFPRGGFRAGSIPRQHVNGLDSVDHTSSAHALFEARRQPPLRAEFRQRCPSPAHRFLARKLLGRCHELAVASTEPIRPSSAPLVVLIRPLVSLELHAPTKHSALDHARLLASHGRLCRQGRTGWRA